MREFHQKLLAIWLLHEEFVTTLKHFQKLFRKNKSVHTIIINLQKLTEINTYTKINNSSKLLTVFIVQYLL